MVVHAAPPTPGHKDSQCQFQSSLLAHACRDFIDAFGADAKRDRHQEGSEVPGLRAKVCHDWRLASLWEGSKSVQQLFDIPAKSETIADMRRAGDVVQQAGSSSPVTCERAEAIASVGQSSGRQSISPSSICQSAAGEVQPGDIVSLIGLNSAPQMNGARGVCLRFCPSSSRWLVQLESGVKNVREKNLAILGSVLVPQQPSDNLAMKSFPISGEAAPDANARDLHCQALLPGTKVTLHGLLSAPEKNGTSAVCIRFDPISGRWVVRMVSGEERNVKPQNLKHEWRASTAEIAVSCTVRLTEIVCRRPAEVKPRLGLAAGERISLKPWGLPCAADEVASLSAECGEKGDVDEIFAEIESTLSQAALAVEAETAQTIDNAAVAEFHEFTSARTAILETDSVESQPERPLEARVVGDGPESAKLAEFPPLYRQFNGDWISIAAQDSNATTVAVGPSGCCTVFNSSGTFLALSLRKCSLVHDGESFSGELSDDGQSICWSDGDVWHRVDVLAAVPHPEEITRHGDCPEGSSSPEPVQVSCLKCQDKQAGDDVEVAENSVKGSPSADSDLSSSADSRPHRPLSGVRRPLTRKAVAVPDPKRPIPKKQGLRMPCSKGNAFAKAAAGKASGDAAGVGTRDNTRGAAGDPLGDIARSLGAYPLPSNVSVMPTDSTAMALQFRFASCDIAVGPTMPSPRCRRTSKGPPTPNKAAASRIPSTLAADGETSAHPPCASPPSFAAGAQRRILQKDVERHGATPGCAGCKCVLLKGDEHSNHSSHCRSRMLLLLRHSRRLKAGPRGAKGLAFAQRTRQATRAERALRRASSSTVQVRREDCTSVSEARPRPSRKRGATTQRPHRVQPGQAARCLGRAEPAASTSGGIAVSDVALAAAPLRSMHRRKFTVVGAEQSPMKASRAPAVDSDAIAAVEGPPLFLPVASWASRSSPDLETCFDSAGGIRSGAVPLLAELMRDGVAGVNERCRVTVALRRTRGTPIMLAELVELGGLAVLNAWLEAAADDPIRGEALRHELLGLLAELPLRLDKHNSVTLVEILQKVLVSQASQQQVLCLQDILQVLTRSAALTNQ